MAPASFIPISNTVCVMDASTCLGESLVRKLLRKGYIVHAAVQSQPNGELQELLMGLCDDERERLKIFDSDLFDYHSLLDALKGCSGLFYNFELPHDQSIYDEHSVEIEVRAAHNVLEACAQTDTIDKVVFTSSATAVIWREDRKSMPSDLDERHWTDVSFCRKFKLWHALAKTIAEKTAWALAMDRGISMVTVNAGLLVGPDLTVRHPYLKGASEMYQDGVLVTVDLNFLVDAHIYVCEEISSYGRYLCFNHVINRPEDAIKLAKMLIPSASVHSQRFVSNLTGSSLFDIFLLALVIPVIVLLRRAIGFNYPHSSDVASRSSKKNDDVTDNANHSSAFMLSMAVDFFFIVIPILLILTVFSEWTHVLAVSLTLFLAFYVLIERLRFSSSVASLQAHDAARKSISSFRVATMIITCLCILAVDFKIFPRKYAKTETYGTSWMDLGVGSFVLANALVSRQARNIHSGGWKTAFQSTCPLIFLGVVRLVSTTGVNYQVHVGEYGVHWNFFFTLAAVSLLTSTFNIHPQYCGILGLFVLIGYQTFLMQGLNEYLLSDVRGMDIISQNKEGVFSIFGYWGMYLVGVQMGYHLFFQNNIPTSSHRDMRTRKRVFVITLVLWLLTVVLDQHVERVSRRTCNMAYVMLVLAVNFQVLAIFMLSEYTPGRNFTVLEGAFNRNLLASFLLANVFTGLVNLSVDTLTASSIQALFVLVTYAFALCFFMGLADYFDFRLKFW